MIVNNQQKSANFPETTTANNNNSNNSNNNPNPDVLCNDPVKDAALKELCRKTGYAIKQENGQRKYGGPPPGWTDRIPGKGCEIFVGKLPRDLYEDELVPVLEKCGQIYELRLMMDFSGNNRGFAFVKYFNQEQAKRALKELNNHEIRKGRLLGVCKSVDNCRLFVGGIPKSKQRDEILAEMQKLSEGVVDVIVYPAAADKTKNRGFAFVEFQDHHTAAMARRKLMHTRPQVWGHPLAVDWAEPEVEVDEDVMAQVKILYVRNLMLHTTEEQLEKEFTAIVPAETIERVKKIRDYGFVHFSTRENAIKCMNQLNGKLLDGSPMEVTLAKPVDRETYVRYTRAATRNATETPDSPFASQIPGLVTAPYGIDPVAAAATAQYGYAGAPQIYYTNPYAAAAAVPGLPAAAAIPRYSFPAAIRGGIPLPAAAYGIPQIGAAGVPLGIPGATTGLHQSAANHHHRPSTMRGGRNYHRPGIAGRGGAAGGRNFVIGGRAVTSSGYQATYYNNHYNKRMTPQQPHQVASGRRVLDEKYDLQPDMELIPMEPPNSSHNQQQKPSTQLLEEYCKKAGLEMPQYRPHSVTGQNGRQLYLYRVELRPISNNNQQRAKQSGAVGEPPKYPNNFSSRPSNPNNSNRQYTPTKLFTSLDGAKEEAATHVLALVANEKAAAGQMRPEASGFQPGGNPGDESGYPTYATNPDAAATGNLMNNYH